MKLNVLDENMDKFLTSAYIVNLLAKREVEVFMLLGKGMCCKHIAKELNFGTKTAENHRFRIGRKLGITESRLIAILGWRLRHHLPTALAIKHRNRTKRSPASCSQELKISH